MTHDRPYYLLRHIPAPRLRDADSSERPHTYGVRLGPCRASATEPCRPTACTTHATNLSSSLTDNCSLVTYHCSLSNLISTILHSSFLILNWSHTFSAKERDAETGLSYFGARYYSSDLSIWLSVDPMASKYPSLSPYVYCANSPVMVIDPNGADTIFIDKKTGMHKIKDCEGKDVLVCGYNKETLSSKGVFATAKGDENQSNDFQTLLTGMTGEDAAKVFNFMADNTDVEWGYMRTNSGEYFIGTNHTNEGQDGESVISKMVMDALPNTVGNYTHSHWSDKYSTTGWTPSTFNTANDSKNSDHKAWKDILINQPKITMGIRYKGLTKCWIKKGKPVEGFDNFYTTD